MTTVKRRFTTHTAPGRPNVLAAGHPAVIEGRPLFKVKPGSAIDHKTRNFPPLRSGVSSRKIGDRVVKGAWSGMPIYTLTLQERATCPRSCKLWRSCYGNNMPWAARQTLDDTLLARITSQLGDLNRKHPRGFVVRLHVLGDFAAPYYAQFWHDAFELFPALRVFGYTAWQPLTEVGKIVAHMNARFPDRCRIRFSNPTGEPVKPLDRFVSVVIPSYHGKTTEALVKLPRNVVICPAQTGKTDCCGTCALCWSTERVIAFLQH